MDTEQDKEDV